MKQKLKCLSEKTANELYDNILLNTDRYRETGFSDVSTDYGWSVELQVYVDLDPLKDLEGSPGQEFEVKNSLLVWQSLKELTPGLASENRVWARMTHVEGFQYAKERWLDTNSEASIVKSVQEHFFADTRTKYRDDNALSRLWWVAYIASLAYPLEQKTVLELILSKADIRSNFIERPQISSRPKLAAGILRTMLQDNWVISKEENYRLFMKQVNKLGGGILFEVWNNGEIDEFMRKCASAAKSGTAQLA